MGYEILDKSDRKVIRDADSGFCLIAGEQREILITERTAFAIATMYVVSKNGFSPEKIFIFQVADSNENVLSDAELDLVKAGIDFFFRSYLATELYVKEIPEKSSLYPQEAARLFGGQSIGVD